MADGFIQPNDPKGQPQWGVEYLYELPGERLSQGRDGKAVRSLVDESSAFQVPNRPSLSGPTPHPGTKGIGGTVVGGGGGVRPQAAGSVGHAAVRPQLTPQDLMAIAKRMEAEFAANLAKGASVKDQSSGPPEWLANYMDDQSVPSKVDNDVLSKYIPEREQLRSLKSGS